MILSFDSVHLLSTDTVVSDAPADSTGAAEFVVPDELPRAGSFDKRSYYGFNHLVWQLPTPIVHVICKHPELMYGEPPLDRSSEPPFVAAAAAAFASASATDDLEETFQDDPDALADDAERLKRSLYGFDYGVIDPAVFWAICAPSPCYDCALVKERAAPQVSAAAAASASAATSSRHRRSLSEEVLI